MRFFCGMSVLFLLISVFAGRPIFAADCRHDDFSSPINKILPSLVQVRSLVPHNDPSPHFDAPSGTGVILSQDGFIVTNAHVVISMRTTKKYDRVEVQIGRHKYLPARIIGIDIETDLALIKINAPSSWEKLTPAKFPKVTKLTLGSVVLKAGFPGSAKSKNTTLAHGIITNLRVFMGDFSTPHGTTDTHLSGGDSGGPLFNTKGEVVGIDKAVNDGMGYFIPAAILMKVLPKLYKGDIHTGWLGFNPSECLDMRDVNNDDYLKEEVKGYLKTKGMALSEAESGILIMLAPEKGIGDSGLLKIGDVIISINGNVPQDRRELIQWLTEMKPGSEALFKILREGKRALMRLKIGEFDWTAHSASVRDAPTEKH